MKTKIIFNALGRPLWLPTDALKRDTGKHMHRMSDYRRDNVTFTDADLEWFRKPLNQ